MAETRTKTGVINVLASVETRTKTGAISVYGAGETLLKTGVVNVLASVETRTKTGAISVTVSGPSVDAGPNLTVEAGTHLDLTPQVETPATGSTITGRTWAASGATVGTSRTVTVAAPITRNGAAITYTYTATDSNGATGSSSLTVTVRPATRRTGGGRPLIRRTGPSVASDADPGYGAAYGNSYGN